MPDPGQLDAAAATLEVEAAAVPSLLDPAIGRAGLNTWEGPAQADLWSQLRDLRAQLVSAGHELRSVAGQLRSDASDIRTQQALEERRRQEAANPAGSSSRTGGGGRVRVW